MVPLAPLASKTLVMLNVGPPSGRRPVPPSPCPLPRGEGNTAVGCVCLGVLAPGGGPCGPWGPPGPLPWRRAASRPDRVFRRPLPSPCRRRLARAVGPRARWARCPAASAGPSAPRGRARGLSSGFWRGLRWSALGRHDSPGASRGLRCRASPPRLSAGRRRPRGWRFLPRGLGRLRPACRLRLARVPRPLAGPSVSAVVVAASWVFPSRAWPLARAPRGCVSPALRPLFARSSPAPRPLLARSFCPLPPRSSPALRPLTISKLQVSFGHVANCSYLCTRKPINNLPMKHNAIIGSGSGKFGNMVAYVRGGVQMARVYQPVVANPRTLRQLVSRGKMVEASILSRGLALGIRFGFGADANSRVSARNLFTREAIAGANPSVQGETPQNINVDYEKVLISDGRQGSFPLELGELDFATPLTVTVPIDGVDKSFSTNHLSDGTEQSVALAICVFSRTHGTSFLWTGVLYDKATAAWSTALDEGQVVAIRLPGAWQGDYVEVYAFTKLLPDALNGVPVSQFPYRIPGPSTQTFYCGTGRVG